MKNLLKTIAACAAVALVATIGAMAQEDILTGDYSAAGYSLVYPTFHAPTETSTSLTNGQTFYVIAARTVLSGVGSASGLTNTITIGQPYRVPGLKLIRVDAASTNKIKIADSASVLNFGRDLVLAAGDLLVLDVIATNVANLISYKLDATESEVAAMELYDNVITKEGSRAVLEYGSTTNGGTVTWNALFGAVGGVSATYLGDAGTNVAGARATCYVSAFNITNCTVAGDSVVNTSPISVLAVGTAP